jgi:hypothetical protein
MLIHECTSNITVAGDDFMTERGELAEMLIKSGAVVDARDKTGETGWSQHRPPLVLSLR